VSLLQQASGSAFGAFNLKNVNQAACPKLKWNVNAESNHISGLRKDTLLQAFLLPSLQARICKLSLTIGIAEGLDAFGSVSEKRVYRSVSHYNSGKR
jgi:hypothetical protein